MEINECLRIVTANAEDISKKYPGYIHYLEEKEMQITKEELKLSFDLQAATIAANESNEQQQHHQQHKEHEEREDAVPINFLSIEDKKEESTLPPEIPNQDHVYETWQNTFGSQPLSLREKRHGEEIHGDLMKHAGVVNLHTHIEF